ncbi:MAG: pirin family protein [Cellvibrionaceae bacterium]
MSNLTDELQQECVIERGCDAVELIIHPKQRELGGFSVNRVLPNQERRMVGPWVFFDHMGPAQFAAGHGIDVRPHPHINLATVTYLFEGEILHRDSLGSLQAIRPGDVNLMVAGSGIVHSERERPEHRSTAHTLHGLQLWLALPEEFEEVPPAFFHYPRAVIPSTSIAGVSVRTIMGSAYGLTSPVKTYADTLYVEAHLRAGQRLSLPESEECAVYVASGSLKAGATDIGSHAMAVFSSRDGVHLEAQEDARIAIIGGAKLGPRFMEWNFVSSRKERIEQAKADWQTGRFAKIPGDDQEYIPLP